MMSKQAEKGEEFVNPGVKCFGTVLIPFFILIAYSLSGLERWEKLRADWLRPKPGCVSRKSQTEVRAKTIDVEDVIERCV